MGEVRSRSNSWRGWEYLRGRLRGPSNNAPEEGSSPGSVLPLLHQRRGVTGPGHTVAGACWRRPCAGHPDPKRSGLMVTESLSPGRAEVTKAAAAPAVTGAIYSRTLQSRSGE